MNKKIILATDHAGFKLKEEIKEFLANKGYEVDDVGAHSLDQEDDYPDFIIPAAKKVAKEQSRGIILGSSGQGEAIAANKVKGIRAALYYGKNMDIVKLSRTHNNANILSFGARFITQEKAADAVDLWLNEPFEGGRHKIRVDKLDI